MKVVLVCGDERVEIEGDDDCIREDPCYQGTFERKVAEISQLFYTKQEDPLLVNDCMASDFNEHRDSCKEAQRLLTQLQTRVGELEETIRKDGRA